VRGPRQGVPARPIRSDPRGRHRPAFIPGGHAIPMVPPARAGHRRRAHHV